MEKILLDVAIGLGSLILGYIGKHLLTRSEVKKIQAEAAKAVEEAKHLEMESERLRRQLENETEMTLIATKSKVVMLSKEATDLSLLVKDLTEQLHDTRIEIQNLMEENKQLKIQLEECRNRIV